MDLSDLMYITHGTESLTDAEIEPGTYSADVYGCKKALEVFLGKNQDEDAVSQIWDLVRKDRREREKIVDKELSDIGRFSLILPARVIVYLTAEIKKESFWEYWKEMHETVYQDEIMKEYASQELKAERKKLIEAPIPPVRTSEVLQNSSKAGYRVAVKLLKKISDENREEGKIIEKAGYSWDLTSRNAYPPDYESTQTYSERCAEIFEFI